MRFILYYLKKIKILLFYKKINYKKKGGKNRLFDITLAKKYYIN
jgi:hypothetical protein